MNEQAATATPPGELTPEAATARRQELMANPEWRAGAVTGKGDAWAELQRLDALIAPAEAEDATGEPMPPALSTALQDGDDGEAPDGFFDPPASPGEYMLPSNEARAAGLEVDSAAEMDLRTGLHAAGVDNTLAGTIYSAAMNAALQPRTSVQEEAEHRASEQALRQQWGTAFDVNMKAANDEARAIFHFLPHSITRGQSFAEYVRGLGLGNSRIVIEQLFARVKRRSAR